MYGVGTSFWLNLFLLMSIFFVSLTVFNALLRKRLGVEKPKAFSYNHVNDLHKKIDWGMRIFFVAIIVIGSFINAVRLPHEPYLLLQPWFFLFALISMTEIVRAIMERKYAKNPNTYIYTLGQLVFIVVFLMLLFVTDFFGIF